LTPHGKIGDERKRSISILFFLGAKVMDEVLACLCCGKPFEPTRHITRQKYCSRECCVKYNNAKRRNSKNKFDKLCSDTVNENNNLCSHGSDSACGDGGGAAACESKKLNF
jgi:hypothetical protein